MAQQYPVRVALWALRPYLTDPELLSRLYKLFDVVAKPWQKCWSFDVRTLIGKPLGTMPNAILFETREQAERFISNINGQFNIVMAEPLAIDACTE